MKESGKFDGVIEAVRLAPDGRVAMARTFERIGPAYKDSALLSREQLVARLKAGKKYVVGKRTAGQGFTFVTGASVRLVDGALRLEPAPAGETAELPGVPVF